MIAPVVPPSNDEKGRQINQRAEMPLQEITANHSQKGDDDPYQAERVHKLRHSVDQPASESIQRKNSSASPACATAAGMP